jgi:hypothetical protein
VLSACGPLNRICLRKAPRPFLSDGIVTLASPKCPVFEITFASAEHRAALSELGAEGVEVPSAVGAGDTQGALAFRSHGHGVGLSPGGLAVMETPGGEQV